MVCNQSKTSMEKQLAKRQLTLKSLDNNSWFIDVEKLLHHDMFG